MTADVNRSPSPLPLEVEAKRVAEEQGFMIEKEIYRGSYYAKGHVRNLIYAGEFKGQAAVLKIYNDPRLTDEPRSLAAFHQHNTSQKLGAPKLYASALTSVFAGWMIVERLPEGGSFFQTPMSTQARREFLEVYLEYRSHFPGQPTRELELAEQLPADEFTSARMSRWAAMAHEKDAVRAKRGGQRLFSSKDVARYVKGIRLIRAGMQERPMVWCHGHFKPQEVYKTKEGKYYLLDFAHTHLFPQGYEFAFMVWADQLMTVNEETTLEQLSGSVASWITDFTPIAKQFGWKEFEQLARVSILERLLGTVLADIGSSDQPLPVMRQKIDLLWKLFDQLVG